jgi:4-hydroxybenzoate polyprenyltransferase
MHHAARARHRDAPDPQPLAGTADRRFVGKPQHPAIGLLVHLRAHFQLLLAPIFLWGFFLGGGVLTFGALWAFVIFHVLLYGGATAFNSAYDRDVGPVGGLERPPPVSRALLPFAVAVLVLGWACSATVSWAFFTVYGGILVLAVAYSHPATRWKAGPWASLATIFVGQGVLGFLGGWTAASPGFDGRLGLEGLLGGLAASLIVVGFYPLTQLFQLEEDRARGDRTVAVAWGAARCFRLSEVALLLGALAVLAVILPRYGAAEGVLASGFFVALLLAVEAWRRRFEPGAVTANFHWVMRLNAVTALALAGYVALHLVLRN